MKLWEEPESRSAMATASPTEMKIFIVWKPCGHTPVAACREILGPGVFPVSVEHWISSSTSSSASSSSPGFTTSRTNNFLQRCTWTYFSSQLKQRPSARRWDISDGVRRRRDNKEGEAAAVLLDPGAAEDAEAAPAGDLAAAAVGDCYAARFPRPGTGSDRESYCRCSYARASMIASSREVGRRRATSVFSGLMRPGV
jgi:hypothetical protein